MRIKLKTRIFFVLALTLVLMLVCALLIFNTFGEGYIRGQAQQDLNEASIALDSIMQGKNYILSPDYGTLSEPLKLIRDLMRNSYLFSDDNIFIMNSSGYIFTMNEDNSKEALLAMALLAEPQLFDNTASFPVQNEGSSFYAITRPISRTADLQWYAVIYVDTSLLHELLKNQSNLLLLSLGVSGILVVLLAYFLISLQTKPINKLKGFARRIGEGDFTPDNTKIDASDLAELHTEMNHMANRLNDNREEQKRFFQNISHDLRTPLMSIQGYAEGIQYGVFQDTSHPAEVILEESRRMYGMVDNLVYLSYMETADIKLNTVMDIRESLSRSIEKLQGVAMHEGKELICDFDTEELLVLLDESSLGRAWQNLLSNALRYCRKQVIISCYRKDNKAAISIRDDGAGFEPADIEHIFKRFYKGKKGNYGLGLSISREAIENHQGSIAARNNPQNGGAEMLITLPILVSDKRVSLRKQ